ncbi:MAG: GreA/GreB family elongation factor [Elusimicrobia bacterium]|nr:GreA/GreB family elongation factor [Elusimicrobiota bacterium]
MSRASINYVTHRGLVQLREKARELAALLARLRSDPTAPPARMQEIERELQDAQGRVESAILIDNAGKDASDILFGAAVEVKDASGNLHLFSIVGEDEADPGSGKLSWTSPLARALYGLQVGSAVTWPRPEGDLKLEIIAIRYPRD